MFLREYCALPEIIVHGFEEKFIVGFIEDIFEVGESDVFGGYGQFDEIRSLLLVEVIDDLGLRHGGPLLTDRARASALQRRALPASTAELSSASPHNLCALCLHSTPVNEYSYRRM